VWFQPVGNEPRSNAFLTIVREPRVQLVSHFVAVRHGP